MKEIGLILSSNLRSEVYFKTLSNIKGLKISFVLLYGKKSKVIFSQKKIKNFYFFNQKKIDDKIANFVITQKIRNFIISPSFGEIIKNKELLKKKILFIFIQGSYLTLRGALPYFTLYY